MRLHPLLSDPKAVLVSLTPSPDPPGWETYRCAARQMMAAMQVELDGEKVVIKPNVTVGERFADPDTGIGTHPGFVQGMLDYLNVHGRRKHATYIVEDPRNTDDNEPRHWRGTGYDTLATQTGVKLRTPNVYACVTRTVPNPQALTTLRVSRLAVAPDAVLFNVPKLKTHNLAITTLCLKNLMGLVTVFDRHFCAQAWNEMPEEMLKNERPREEWLDRASHERWQAGLARRLIDTAQIIRPHLNLVEGIVGREGTGFQRGRNWTLGLAVAGVNMVAVDSVASYLMGFDPRRLIYLRLAAEAGLGVNNLAELAIYTVKEGNIVPCPDITALRAQPPFRVISNIVDEEA